jgi:hypothetical protein
MTNQIRSPRPEIRAWLLCAPAALRESPSSVPKAPAPFALFATFCSPSAHRCVHDSAMSCKVLKTRLRSPDLPRQPNATICNIFFPGEFVDAQGRRKPARRNKREQRRTFRQPAESPFCVKGHRGHQEHACFVSIVVPLQPALRAPRPAVGEGSVPRRNQTGRCSEIQRIAAFEN